MVDDTHEGMTIFMKGIRVQKLALAGKFIVVLRHLWLMILMTGT